MNLDSNTLYVFFIFGMFVLLLVVTFDDDCNHNSNRKQQKKSKSKKNDNTQYIYVIKDNSDMPTNNIISSNMKRRPRYDDDYLEYEEIREIEYDRYTRSDHDQYKLYNNTFIDDLEPATL